jgi:Asp-tRNA(Asn)/Glu-tRNA(Gln) amidotransferase A subunit family amidase
MTTRGDLWRFDAVELAAAIRTRRISSREAVGSHLDRLASVNPYINAVVDPLAAEALAEADAADELTEIRYRKDHPTFFVPGRTAGIAASDSGTASGS